MNFFNNIFKSCLAHLSNSNNPVEGISRESQIVVYEDGIGTTVFYYTPYSSTDNIHYPMAEDIL